MKANFILGKKQIVLASLVVVLGAAVYLNWQFANSSVELDTAGQVNTTVSGEESEPEKTPGPADEPGLLSTAAGESDSAAETVSAPSGDSPESELAPLPTDGAITEPAAPTDADPLKDAGAGEPDAADPSLAEKDSTRQGETKMLGDAKFVSSASLAEETYFTMAKLARTHSRDEAIETVATILDNSQLTEADKKLASEKAVALSEVIETESRIENLVKAKGFAECMAYITEASASVVVKTDGLSQDQATQIKNIVVSEGRIKGENVSITEVG